MAPPADSTGNNGQDNLISQGREAFGGGRILCGYWDCAVNTQTLEVEATPLREADFHANMVSLMNSPGNIEFKYVSGAPLKGQFTYDITLTHPYSYPKFNGHDVRGIVIGSGPYLCGSKADPDLMWIAPGGFRLLNADGWTRWWNQNEFSTEGMYGFTAGIFGTPGFPGKGDKKGMLNPYKYFAPCLGATDPVVPNVLDSKGEFTAGGSATRRYEMQFPLFGGIPDVRFQYAIDASWAPPSGGNCPEAFYIKVDITENTLWYYNDAASGGELGLQIEVFDWGAKDNPEGIDGEITTICLESDTLFDSDEPVSGPASPGSSVYSGVYTFSEFSDGLHPAGLENQEILVRVEAKGPLSYKPPVEGPDYPPEYVNLTAYAMVTVPIEDTSGEFELFDVTPVSLNFSPKSVFQQGDYLYAACGSRGLIIFDNSNPSDPIYLSTFDTGMDKQADAIDVVASGDYAYIVDISNGLYVLDVSQHSAPELIKYYKAANEYSWWPECLTYDSGYVYVGYSSYNFGGKMEIYDTKDPSSTFKVIGVGTPSFVNNISTSNGYAYVSNYDEGLLIFDATQPASTHLVKTLITPGYVNDCQVKGDLAYVCENYYGVEIYNVSVPGEPSLVSKFDTPGRATEINCKGNYAYIADRGGGIQIASIEDPAAPYLVGCSKELLHNATNLNLLNDMAYVCSEDLNVVDVKQPETPAVIDYKGLPFASCSAINGGMAYVCSQNDLYFIDVSSPGAASVIKKLRIVPEGYKIGDGRFDAKYSDGYLYVAEPIVDQDNSLLFVVVVIEVEPVETASVVGFKILTAGGSPWYDKAEIQISNGYAYVSDNQQWTFYALDIGNPEAIKVVQTIITGVNDLCVPEGSGYAYALGPYGDLEIIDIDPPEEAHVSYTFHILDAEFADGIAYENGLIYLITASASSDDTCQMAIVDVDPPEFACVVNVIDTAPGFEMVADNGYVYATGYGGMKVYDVDPPESAHLVAGGVTPCDQISATHITRDGKYFYVSDSECGLFIFETG